MTTDLRNALQNATQRARRILETEVGEQLEGRYDVLPDGTVADEPGPHLDAAGRALRRRIVAAIEHERAGGKKPAEAVAAFRREAAFTLLNRFVALKMLEARGIIPESVSKGEESSGFKNDFTLLAPGLSALPDKGYRLYLETLFDELGREVRVLFDRRATTGRLWPRRAALAELLGLLNDPALADAWRDEEALGWVYQFFNTRDEIREMREKGRSGPRNSREMAVRNQFFTPDFVVRFLADNTLGRLWWEMRRGDTRLADTCAYLDRRPREVFLDDGEAPPEDAPPDALVIPFRRKKDPRDLRLLDPACGSGHFLLYAFDLFETIYEEAWHDPESPPSEAGGRTLREDYPDLDALRRAVPGLILAHNLHGVDIDPRPAQLAGLALWMRAQAAFDAQGLRPEERPPITRTNVVVAEAMPGESDLRDEFLDALEPPALRPLVAAVFDAMQKADELGMLLRIEETVREAVAEARRAAHALELFEEEQPGERFWASAEQRVLAALRAYAEGEGAPFARRLFADDAARGFAFIELCRQRYDVVLMNPPFGDASVGTKKVLEAEYLDTKNDVLQAFVERADELLHPGGFLGAITSRTPFFLSSAQAWRERVVLRRFRPLLLADFGMGVLDAMVETAAYVLRSLTPEEDRALTLSLLPDLARVEKTQNGTFSVPRYLKARRDDLKRHQAEREVDRLLEAGLILEVAGGRGRSFKPHTHAITRAQSEEPLVAPTPLLVCYRLIGEDDRAGMLHEALGELESPIRFETDPATFADVPGAPFAYWVSDRVRRLFKELPPFESNGRTAKQGLATADDFRFVRLWWEVPAEERSRPEDHPAEWTGPYCVRGRKWFPFAKGGSYSPYYADLHLVVNWGKDGEEIRNFVNPKTGKTYSRPQNTDYYFRPGLTWPARPYRKGWFSLVPRGSLFSHTGMMAFVPERELAPTASILNSDAYVGLLHLLMPRGGADGGQTLKYEVGYIRSVPIPAIDNHFDRLDTLARNAFDKSCSSHTTDQAGHVFFAPTLMSNRETTLLELHHAALGRVDDSEQELSSIQKQVNAISHDLYEIRPADRPSLELSLYGASLENGSEAEATTEDEDGEEPAPLDPAALVHDLVSYALGAAFGRWDVGYATGEREAPPLPDPFEPLPVCPPGMLQGPDGLPLAAPPEGYPIAFPEDGLLVDDPGHERDLLACLRDVLALLFEDPAATEAEAAQLLGEKDLRTYFRRGAGFFEAHRKQYSKSRRKAPIYWPLSTPSGSYTVWLYYPRLTRDTLYRALELVRGKLAHEEGRLRQLENEVHDGTSAAARKRLAAQQDFVAELRLFRDEIEATAPLWRPNLNDGVLLNFAPLHRLFTLHRPWQRELQTAWKKLAKGDYPWAHLALHLWPERVVPLCAERADLALAHGLEDVFFERQPDGSFEPRAEPTQSIESLVAERQSPAVQAALHRLLSAR